MGVGPGVHLANLSIRTPTEQDWYKFQVLRPDSIDVNLGLVGANGQLALQVEDASQNVLGTAVSTSTSTSISVNLPGPIAAGTYYIEVSGVAGAMNTYSLGIDRDAANSAQVYYVNDGSQVNDYYTLAPGSDANDGKTPQTPKATVQSVLNTYGLSAGNLVVIDTGTYTTATTVSAANEGGIRRLARRQQLHLRRHALRAHRFQRQRVLRTRAQRRRDGVLCARLYV